MDIKGRKIPVVIGSVRENRLGFRAGLMVVEALRQAGALPQLIDPVEKPLPMLNLRYFEMPEEMKQGPVKAISYAFRGADAILFVTAEYNHAVPPALKNLIDHFGPPEFKRKPIGIVSYSAGRFGGVRANDQIRLILGTLNATIVGQTVAIPEIEKAIDEKGKPLDPHWEEQLSKLFGEIAFWLQALG